MKLNKLPNKVDNLAARLPVLQHTAGTTRRIKGPPAQKRNARWLMFHPLCVECVETGEDRAAVEVDHKMPLWKGGPDDETNLQGLCREHHAAKTARESRERYAGASLQQRNVRKLKEK